MDKTKKKPLLLVRLMIKIPFFLFTIFGCVITSFANAEKINAVSEGKIISNQSMVVGVITADDNGVKLQKQNNIFYVARSFKPDKFKLRAQIRLKNLNGTGAAFLYDNNKLIFDCARSNFCKHKGAIGFWGRELVGEGVDGYYGIKIIADSKNCITPGKLFNFEFNCDGKTLKFLINGRLLKEVPYLTRQNHTFGFTAHDGEILIHNLEVDGNVAGDAKIFTPDWVTGLRMNIPVIESPLDINRDHHILLKIEHQTPIGTYTAKLTPVRGGNSISFDISVSEVTSDKIVNDGLTAGMERFYVSANIPGKILEQAFVAGGNAFSAKPFILSLSNNGKEILRQILILYQPRSENKFPVCSIQKYKGVPSIAVNGISLGTIPARLSRFARAPRFSGISVSEFDKAGIKVNIITVRPSQFYNDGKFDIDAICKYIDINLCRTVASAPDALIWFDWQLYMPKQWCDRHPQEMIRLENGLKFLQHSPGQILQPSYASSRWRKDAGRVLQDTLLRLSSSLWADRIIMVRTSYGNAGEWNHWGYKSKQFVDFSIPMQKAFGKWLKEKYKNVDKLRAAWNDPDVTFDSMKLVPSSKMRIAADDSILYRIGSEGQPAADYYIFFQKFAVETIEYFAKIIKQASNDKLLAGAYYGYYLSHINNTPYHLQDSGHYGLQYYLRSKYLDFLGGPYPYHQRQNRLQINGLYSSIALHDKVWFSENDQRTHLSDKSIHLKYGATSNVKESIAIAKRDYMLNFSKATSYYYFDFIKDWFITPEYMEAVKDIKQLDDIVMKNGGRPSRAEVAVLFSEKSVPYYANHPVLENSSLRGFLCALRNMLETEMDRTGVPWDLYAVSDMDKIDFSKYKLIIFTNSNYVTNETIKLTNSS